MEIAITGASGLVGSALVPVLEGRGHAVRRLVRRPARGTDEISWDPGGGRLDPEDLRGIDAVVHLSGESIGARRWSDEQKRRIRDSRTQSTDLVARTLAGIDDPEARVLVYPVGVNYYGDRGADILTEDEPAGAGFLADVCVDWEAAAAPARAAGVRVATLRTGQVLAPGGGSLGRMLPLFKLGVGGRFGSGEQYWSWITVDDQVALIVHALAHADVSGPLNACAPNPVPNAAFTRILGRVLGRPAVLPIPKFGPVMVLGELADTLLFDSIRAVPERAQESGFTFRHPDLEAGLRAVLGR